MIRDLRTICMTAVIAATAVATLSAAITFISTFKSLDAGGTSFLGKKVAALVMSNDFSLRVPAEEALARELNARGMQAVATYRIVPKEELTRADGARPWFEKQQVDGVVVIRPLSAGTRPSYTSSIWVTSNYNTFWNYYGYGWSTVYIPGTVRGESVVVVETTIYDVPKNQLLWAAVSETSTRANLQGYIAELSQETVREMQKQGLARSQPGGSRK